MATLASAEPVVTTAFLEISEEIWGLIFMKLPLLYMFTLRCVCKEWNVIFQDVGFVKKFSERATSVPWFFWPIAAGKYAVYNPVRRMWAEWPLKFILMDESWQGVLGASHGCVLIRRFASELYIVNPLTRSAKRLTRIKSGDIEYMGMYFVENSKSFKILYREIQEEFVKSPSDSFYIYDSYDQSKMLVKVGVKGKVTSWTLHHGAWYFLVSASVYQRISCAAHTVYELYRFDGPGRLWQHLKTLQAPRDLFFSYLFEWKHKLMLVGGKPTAEQGAIRSLASVEIWEWDEEEKCWMQFSAMPDSVLLDMSYSSPFSFRVLNGGDYIFIVTSNYQMETVVQVSCNLREDLWCNMTLAGCDTEEVKCTRFVGYGGFILDLNFDSI